MYFQTTDDLLNLVLAVVIAATGVAFIWLIVEIIRIVRPVRKLVETVDDRISRIDAALQKIVSIAASIINFVPGLLAGRSGKRPKK